MSILSRLCVHPMIMLTASTGKADTCGLPIFPWRRSRLRSGENRFTAYLAPETINT
ncbi:MAG: hypothetical protein GPOALKHO_000745 [Sodalis sp.]|nr:MAG: hypothetical protein GPOALKHO_000745 [Sodalis sp.]